MSSLRGVRKNKNIFHHLPGQINRAAEHFDKNKSRLLFHRC
jgi:hypothetical protein